MVRILSVLLCIVALGACVSATDDWEHSPNGVNSAEYTLQLLHFADIDGDEEAALDAVDEFSALLESFRSEYASASLVVSSGDVTIPGPRYFAAENRVVRSLTGSNEPGHGDIFFLNSFAVAASAVGNHELDAGPGEFADSFQAESGGGGDFAGASFPWLAANLSFDDNDFTIGRDGDDVSNMAGQVARSATITVAGETIGLVGATTPNLASITTTGNIAVLPEGDWTNEGLAAVIQEAVDGLSAAGVNKIVLLSHMQQIDVERALAELLSDVDIIVAGGSNTLLADEDDVLRPGDEAVGVYPLVHRSVTGEPVLVVNVDGDYQYLGRLVVGFDGAGVIDLDSLDQGVNGAWATTEDQVASLGGRPDRELLAVRDALRQVIDETYSNVLGYTDVYLDGRRNSVRTQETNLGSLTADANLWYANLLSSEPVTVSIKNGGGIRTEIGAAVVPPGDSDGTSLSLVPPPSRGTTSEGAVTEGHLKATLRFDNGLALLSADAEELKDIFEHAFSATRAGATPGQFPQIAGVRVGYDPRLPARQVEESGGIIEAGERVRYLYIVDGAGTVLDRVVEDGVVLGDAGRRFRIVTLNFLANGGDGYPFPDLSDPNRENAYAGTGFGEEVDYPDLNLDADPGANDSFSYTGGEQDALAEYLGRFHAGPSEAFNGEETGPNRDERIQDLSVRNWGE